MWQDPSIDDQLAVFVINREHGEDGDCDALFFFAHTISHNKWITLKKAPLKTWKIEYYKHWHNETEIPI